MSNVMSNVMKEALLYDKLEENKVRCNLCAHRCVIAEGRKGVCQVRRNVQGVLETLVYGRIISGNVDPVEKKPLYHFYPGSTAYSIATPGCNFRCEWCQNYEISQMPRERDLIMGHQATPEQIVADCMRVGSRSIAYTYTEPTVFFEYAYDIARLARQAGIANIFVTNGFMTEEMLELLCPYLDAANVDLKAFRDETYRRRIGGRLQPVLDSLKKMKQQRVWVEVTTLIIPGINDEPAELQDIAAFIATELGRETPWHVSRFFPMYKMTDTFPTPVSTLERAIAIGAQAGLHYIYAGNLHDESNTVCHRCGHTLVRRIGYQVTSKRVTSDGKCPNCGEPVAGIGMSA